MAGPPILPMLSVLGVALLLFGVTLWGPQDLRTGFSLGSTVLILLITLREWISTLENRRLSDYMERQLYDFNLLLESSRIMTSPIHKRRMEAAYSATVRIAHGLVQADLVGLPLLNPDGSITYKEAYGRSSEILKGVSYPAGQGGLCSWVVAHRETAISENLTSDPRANPALADQLDVNTAIVVPIIGEEGVMGGISAFRKSRPYTAYDAKLLRIFAYQAGTVYENLKTYLALEQRLEELKLTQEELIQTERLAAVGHLVSGVAHELNNPLTSILGFSEIIKDHPALDPELRKEVECIFEEAVRSKGIIQNLLRFGRRQSSPMTPADINEVLRMTLSLREYHLQINHIGLDKNIQESLPPILLNVPEIQQVFLSLLINAEQAILDTGKAGTISVTTTCPAPGKIIVEFQDTGVGIPRENLAKIFEPFYSTREIGKGNGLGLAIAYGVIQRHGGRIEVSSEEGRGARFTVHLPVGPTTETRRESFNPPAGP